jgi:diguanylate cyclase (GGDEF)-like protein/PAS domain S-box-containing protein
MKNLINFITNQIHIPNVKDKVTKELYGFIPKTLGTSILLSIIFTLLFWSQVVNTILLEIWLSLVLLLNLSRFYDYKQQQKDDQNNYIKWYNSFNVKALIHALLWGITPLLFFSELQESYQLVMLLFLSGIAGAVTGFIFDFKISATFISVILAPIFVMFFFSSIPYSLVLQILILTFYLLLLTASKHLNQLFYETYTNQERYHWAKEMLSVKEKNLNAFLEQTPVGIFYYDNDLKIIKHNTMCKKLFGIEPNLNNFNLNHLKDKQVLNLLSSVLHSPSEKETIGSFDFSFAEEKLWIELTCSSLLDDNNEIIGGIGTIEDKTSEHLAYEKINHISHHDALTGLPNRRSYQEYMETLIEKVEHTDNYSFLFYMDLNHFKQINDTFGHVVGDKLLLEVSERLRSLTIPRKHLARIGGDEFIMIIPFHQQNIISAKKEAKEIALLIKNLFNEAFHIEGLDLYMTTSIGIVLIEPNCNDLEQIIRQADMAMYQTKREGLNNIRFYDHSLDIEQRELTSLQHELKNAIKNNELELHYQPIVSIKNNTLNAVEALVRWNHPTKGLIMPGQFLPMATESGLITKVGWWVAKEVCKQLYTWKNAKIINFEYISININARQLNEVNFVEQLDSCIKKGGINPSLLKLELTETTLLDNFDKTQSIIQKLKENGIECSIDDFGTGYSSLSYLKKIAFKVLKIDKIFIDDIMTNKDNQELVKSIIAIGKQFNYKVIIEGVETEEQRSQLMQIDEDIHYQGYLCSKAIPSQEFEQRFLTYVYHI